MRKITILLALLLFAVSQGAFAQRTITGTVISSEDGLGMPGVPVVVKGTTVGTATDINGNFTLNVPNDATIVVSFMGFKTIELSVGNQTRINVTLEPDVLTLGDVVVTALGIAKEKKALGYAVSEVKGAELTQAREVNVANFLVGKVAGLNVNQVSGGAGASTNVQIRGMSSISQSNQPLYVIDGIPMSNETSTGTGTGVMIDRGDNIGNINSDNIESISVLKGAAASALYGSRAKAGVVVITTKSGRAGDPFGIEFSSNYVISQAIDNTNFQTDYGQGITTMGPNGIEFVRPTSAANASSTGLSSWGPKIDGKLSIQADGVERPYVAAKNSINNFYRTGGTFTNTIAFTKGFEKGSVRFAATNLDNTSIMPYSGMDRQNFSLSAQYNVTKRLELDVRANYIIEDRKNIPKLNDISGNVNNAILLHATTIDLRDFKENITTANGNEFPLNANVYVANPWFHVKKPENNQKRNRLLASASLRYTFDNGIYIQGRVGRDFYNDRWKNIIPTGTAYSLTGSLTEQSNNFIELNADILAGKEFKVTDDIKISSIIGASNRQVSEEGFNVSGTGFAVPYVYYAGNVPSRTVSYSMSKEESQSVYGTLELDYKKFLYLTGTGRFDWYSTLAAIGESNSLGQFYPSISGSFIFSEFIQSIPWFDFGKLRVGFAQVGQATSPYRTALSYSLGSLPLGTYVMGNISGSTIPNKALKPSLSTEIEIGTDLNLFKSRLVIDFSWYKKVSTDEIVDAPTSVASGFSRASLNIGEMQNSGVELLVSITPIRNNNLTWITSLNGSLNNNKIISLGPGTSSLQWAQARRGPAYIQYIVGLPAAQVVAMDYKRDAAGNITLNPTSGLVEPGELIPLGSAYAKWVAGWSNEFSYKKIQFSFMIDGKFGAKKYSNTESESYTSGKNKETLIGREEVWGNNLTAMDYYQNLVKVSSNFVEDASFIKFRQVVLGYSFPNLFNNTVKNLTVSFVARNLFTIMKKTDNIDPEAAYTGAAIGLDMGTMPMERTFGLNLNVKF